MISGEENDPLGGTVRTMYSEVYERLLFCPEQPPLMAVDFLLDHNGRIIPSLSCGKEIKLIQLCLLPIRLSVC